MGGVPEVSPEEPTSKSKEPLPGEAPFFLTDDTRSLARQIRKTPKVQVPSSLFARVVDFFLNDLSLSVKRMIFQAITSRESLNRGLAEGSIRDEEWDWLTEEQIQNCDWRLLFQTIPIEHIPTLMQKISQMRGGIGPFPWPTHFVYEFIAIYRETSFDEDSVERIKIAIQYVEPENIRDILGFLTPEEMQILLLERDNPTSSGEEA